MREPGSICLLLTIAVISVINNSYACQRYIAPNCEIESDGYFPHEHLCNHFYLCANGHRSLLKCSEDQVFDTDNLMCRSDIKCDERCLETFDYIQCPETPECGENSLGLLLPYPPDCTKYIYCEDDGSGSLSICAPGLHFSAELQGCVDPVEANCPFCVILTTTTIPTTTIAVCPETESCSNYLYGDLLAYPPDCTKYFYCDESGNAVDSVCPTGLHFSESLQGCVDPAEANCPFCIETETTTEEPVDTTTIVPTTTIAVCPEPESCSGHLHGDLLAYPADCTKYFYCDKSGNAVESVCPTGLHFNESLQGCVDPVEANCPFCIVIETTTEESVSTTPTDSTSSVHITTTDSVTTTSPLTTETTTEITTITTPSTTETPPTSTESTITTAISTTEVSTSTTEDLTTIPLCGEVPTCEVGEYGDMKPYPPDCGKYIYCNKFGGEELSKCPLFQEFSPTSLECLPPEQANCPRCEVTTEEIITTTVLTTSTIAECPAIPTCSIGEEGVLKSYPPECTMYIYCYSNATYSVRKCPAGKEFSPNFSKCMTPELAACPYCEILTTPTTIESTTEAISTTEITSTTEIDTTSDTTLTMSSTITTEIIFSTPLPECPPLYTCRITDIGDFKPYPQDCQKFIVCTGRNKYRLVRCLFGRHFSPTLEGCVDPEIAGCPNCSVALTTTESPTPTEEVTTTEAETTTEEETTTEVETTTDSTTITTTLSTTITTDTTSISPLPECPPLYTCRITDIGDFKPYPSDCQKYIVCTGRNTYRLVRCLFGRHFSPTLEGCVNPEIAGCPNCTVTLSTTELPTTTEEVTTSEAETTTEAVTTTVSETSTDSTTVTTLSTTITTDKTSITPLPECPPLYTCRIFDIGALKPYPTDCQKYILCTGRNTYRILKCLFGRHFSPTLGRCANPATAGCLNCTVPITTTPPTTTELTTTTVEILTTMELTTTTVEILTTTDYSTSSVTETIQPCEALRSCSDYPVGKLLPVPANCSQYIYCDGSNSEISFCAPGFSFDEPSQDCLPSDTVVCVTCEPSSTESTTEISTTTTEEILTTIPPCPATPTCENVPEGTTLPYPSNCSMYIYCDAIGEEISYCRPGYHFSIEIGFCVPADQANCSKCFEITTTTIGTTTIPICPATPECQLGEYDTRKPYPPDCTRYVYCNGIIEGPGRIRRCIPGKLFDHVSSQCKNESIAICPYCMVSTTTVTSTETTTWPITTTTDTTTTVTEITTDTTASATATTENITTTTEENTKTTTETSGSSTSTTEYICPTQKTCDGPSTLGHQYPIVGDCKNYIYCGINDTQHRTCSETQSFDYNLEWCVNETDAFCPSYCASTSTEYICPAQRACDGSSTIGDQYPIVGDCKKYIHCGVNGTEYRTCPETQDFDYNLEWCVDESTAFCPTQCATTTTEYICPTQKTCDGSSSLGDQYPIVGDCKKYIHCGVNGTEYRTCPETQDFDYNLEWCVDETTAFCPTQCTTTTPFEPTTSPPAIPTCPPTPTCAMFESGVKKPYPPDCRRYILCDTMQPVLRDCPAGEHFSPSNGRCMLIANAGCSLCKESRTSYNMWSYIKGLFL